MDDKVIDRNSDLDTDTVIVLLKQNNFSLREILFDSVCIDSLMKVNI